MVILTCAKCGEKTQISVKKLAARSRAPLCEFCDQRLAVPDVLPDPDVDSRKSLGFLLILLAAHAPLLFVYCRQLWTFDHYQFYPFALAATALLLIDRIRRDTVVTGKVGWTFVIIDGLLLAGGCLIESPWMVAVGFCCGLVAVVMSTVDYRTDRRPWAAVLPFVSMLRPPAGYDVQLIQHLQLLTSRFSSQLLDRIGVLHVRSGNLIELQDIQLFVEDACSGVQSLFAVLFVTTLIIALRRRSPLHAICLLIAGALCAIAMNIARIVIIAVVWDNWQLDWTAGTSHAVLGYVLLVAAALLALSADRFVRIVGGTMSGWLETIPTEGYANPQVLLWNRLWSDVRPVSHNPAITGKRVLSRVAAAMAVGLCVWQCVTVFTERSRDNVLRPARLAGFELPRKLGAFSVTDRETFERSKANSQGQFSETWQLNNGDLGVTLSCDFPFTGWHDLQACYRGLGWKPQQSRIIDDEWPAIETTFSKPTGERAYLVYSFFDSSGVPVRPRAANDPVGTLAERFKRLRLAGTAWQTYQCQVFLQGVLVGDEEVRRAIRELHNDTRERLRMHLAGGAL